MQTKRRKLTEAQVDALRQRGLKMLKEGRRHQEIADELGVIKRTVRKWQTLYHRGGEEALKVVGAFHRHPLLSAEQLAQLREALLQGAEANGFDTELWTCPRVARLIETKFAVRYHEDPVWKVLHHKLGFSPQRPESRARERDEEAIRQWREERWPEIKKKPAKPMP